MTNLSPAVVELILWFYDRAEAIKKLLNGNKRHPSQFDSLKQAFQMACEGHRFQIVPVDRVLCEGTDKSMALPHPDGIMLFTPVGTRKRAKVTFIPWGGQSQKLIYFGPLFWRSWSVCDKGIIVEEPFCKFTFFGINGEKRLLLEITGGRGNSNEHSEGFTIRDDGITLYRSDGTHTRLAEPGNEWRHWKSHPKGVLLQSKGKVVLRTADEQIILWNRPIPDDDNDDTNCPKMTPHPDGAIITVQTPNTRRWEVYLCKIGHEPQLVTWSSQLPSTSSLAGHPEGLIFADYQTKTISLLKDKSMPELLYRGDIGGSWSISSTSSRGWIPCRYGIIVQNMDSNQFILCPSKQGLKLLQAENPTISSQ